MSKVLALGWLLGVMVYGRAATAADACTCEDLKDLVNRLKEVDMAIAEDEVQMDGMLQKEKQDGKPFQLSADAYKVLEDRVQTAVDRVTDTTANKTHAN